MMDDPDGVNAYWDSLGSPVNSMIDADGFDWGAPATPKLRVVDDEVQAEIEAASLVLPGGIDVGEWDGRNAPLRSFVVPGWIARGHAGLLSGMEGVGKSLAAQQLATCVGLGIPFLGLAVEQCNSAYITCEDSAEELWRRQEAINAMLGVTMADLRGKLFLRSLLGQIGNELGTFDTQGRLTPSERFKQIEAEADRHEWGFIVLDNAAHLFAGNENARHDVAAFLGLLERLSQRRNGAALLLAHPNKQFSQGNTQGNEYSGSTGWSAHVRNRLFLDFRGDPGNGQAVDDDERILRKSKANYGKRGEEIVFRWQDWAFVRPEDLGDDRAREIAEVALVGTENERFLACLDKATEEMRAVSSYPAAANYAPRVFAKMTTANGMTVEQFERAKERLLHIKTIIGEGPVYMRPSNRTWAQGIIRNPAQTTPQSAQSVAQSLHKALHKARTEPAQNPLKAATSHPLPPKGGTTGGGFPPGDMPETGSSHALPWTDDPPPIDPNDWRSNPALNPDWEDY